MSDSPGCVHMTPRDEGIVAEILSSIIPGREVWAFGSRVHGRRLKRFSDLDLCVIGDEPLPLLQQGRLNEAFDESLLPFKVDIVDWATTSERFREIIRAEHVVIQRAKAREKDHPLAGRRF